MTDEQLAEGLADTLALWWEAITGQETYAHEWAQAAEAALRQRPVHAATSGT